MNKVNKIIAITIFLAIAITSTTLAADSNLSDWAKIEVTKAAETDILPDNAFESDLTRPITRAEFARFSLFFVLAQYNMDIDDFLHEYFTAHEIKPNYEAFTDTDDYFVVWAYALGIVSGYGNGIFRPEADITRQEAARMLLNVYKVFGEDMLSKEFHRYADDIADWAVDAAGVMYEWEVMRGVGDNYFDPLGKYTVEQSIVTFLRLYENAPISRSHSNITHFIPFEKSLKYILENQFFQVLEKFELEDCFAIYGEITGVPHGPYSKLWIVYKNGGRREVLQYLPQNIDGWQNDFNIHDMKLNEDNSMLTFIRNYDGQNHYYSISLKFAKLNEISID